MAKRIVYERPDGGLSIVTPVINTHPKPEQISEEEALERALKCLPEDARNVTVVDEGSVPKDRFFRDAWALSGTAIVEDMGRCRSLTVARIRSARIPRFVALDIAYQRADEAGDLAAKAVVAKQKQALRDAPNHPDIVKATTPTDLKAHLEKEWA